MIIDDKVKPMKDSKKKKNLQKLNDIPPRKLASGGKVLKRSKM